jgi:transketolase
MPCWELFGAQPAEYRDEVLPPDVSARVSIEAGVTHGWERWVGARGVSIGVDRFGASAPIARIYEELGLTPERVTAEVSALLERVG